MDAVITVDGSLRGVSFLLSEEGGFDIFRLDPDGWSLLFWTAITFLALLALLTRFAWKPLMQTIEGRETKLRDDIESAERARREAEEIRERHRAELEQAAQEARKTLDEARERGERLKQELALAARSEAEQMVAKARSQIDAERFQALQDIRDEVVDLAVEISRKVAAASAGQEDFLREADGVLANLKERK